MPKEAQLSLFTTTPDGAVAAPLSLPADPSRQSSLAAAISAFYPEMLRRGLSPHTIKAFNLDLKLLSSYLDANRRIGAISSRDLSRFLHYLRHERGVPCSVKSLERRLTTLKVFFEWLAKTRAIDSDPAAPLIHEPSVDPLPRILYEEQITRLLNAARQMTQAEKPDTRPYLLASLVIHTGIKKSECAGILLEHIDLSDPAAPTLWVRYGNPRYTRKERRLTLPKDFAETLAAYQAQYHPKQKLFECSMRNLEYVLTNAGRAAGLSEGVSFEELRMTAAVRDYKAGMAPETMRKKYGLSTITWNAETLPRIKQLAEQPL
ncbi:MAG: site-specific integrase [Chloroflexi bacterium]|nr:site-specific integrase [Chloroflexota bacterium]